MYDRNVPFQIKWRPQKIKAHARKVSNATFLPQKAWLCQIEKYFDHFHNILNMLHNRNSYFFSQWLQQNYLRVQTLTSCLYVRKTKSNIGIKIKTEQFRNCSSSESKYELESLCKVRWKRLPNLDSESTTCIL